MAELEEEERMEKQLEVVIVGSVACGPKVACRLRRLHPSAHITILERGHDISYGACGMPYFISGMVDRMEALRETPAGAVRDVDFFRNVKDVDVICEKEAIAIDRDNKTLKVRDSNTGRHCTLSYDKLVLATGGRPITPEIPGIDAKGVQSFHSLRDADRLTTALVADRAENVVLVGAGLIGIEMAEALIERGLENVTLIERLDWIMPALLDEEMGRLAGKHMRAQGVNLAMGSAVTEFVKDGDGKLTAVKTGEAEYPADLAVVAIGVRPNNELAVEAGLAIAPGGGIIINEYCQTSDPAIYAGGDCVATPYAHPIMGKPVFTPQGSTSNKQGRIIANHIVGNVEAFPGVLGTVICKAFDFTIGRTGLSEAWARELNLDVETVLWAGPDRPHYMEEALPLTLKLVVERKSRRLLGLQVVGPGEGAKRLDVAATAISLGATLEQIAHLDLGYAPPYSPPIDPLLTAVHVMQNKLDGIARGISPTAARDKIEKGEVTLLDVRSPQEFEKMGLPYDLVHIPLGALRAKCEAIPKDKEVLAFCKISLRGYEAQLILEENGFDHVSFIEGGIVGWPFELRSGS
jgi:NADPH-dependent 2,4-dienoyl-CoA reductase/sulfur reductase-like enzyme/rhodanese-related sulfurtransferase